MRKELIARRAALKDETADSAIAAHFFASPFAEAASFFLYLSANGEVGTSRIAAALSEKGKQVFVPRIAGKEMFAVPPVGIKRGAFGIFMPTAGEDREAEIALVPLVAFDGRGNRLGMGGGYYDRYFAAHPKIIRVGLAYAGQEAAFPVDAWDMPLHAVVTEKGLRYFAKP